MALLNPPQTVPHVMFLVYGYLLSAPKQTENAETLRELLAPKALSHWKTRGDDGDAAEKGDLPPHQKVVHFAVNALRALEIIEQNGDDIRLVLAPPKRTRERSLNPTLFKRMLRERILDLEANRNLWSEEGEEIGSRDLTRALAWWLVQDIFEPVGPWADTSPRGVQYRQRQQFGESQKTWLFSNDTRWNTFVRWAVYLGFAWRFGQKTDKQTQTLLVPDPTEAIRETLPVVFSRNKELSMPEFLEVLAERLPVLDGGLHRQAVLDRINVGSVPLAEGDTLTTSLAHVLFRLEAEQVIELRNESDTAKRMFPVETGKAKPYSHIRYLAERGME
ncbi:protein DpdG [Sorangium sp. So ce134]